MNATESMVILLLAILIPSFLMIRGAWVYCVLYRWGRSVGRAWRHEYITGVPGSLSSKKDYYSKLYTTAIHGFWKLFFCFWNWRFKDVVKNKKDFEFVTKRVTLADI